MHMFFIYRALQVYTQIYFKKITPKKQHTKLACFKAEWG